MAEQKALHFDLVGEFIKLKKKVEALERNKTGYGNTGIIHIGEIDPDEVPTAGPIAGGGFLLVENGALKYIATTNTLRQIGQP